MNRAGFASEKRHVRTVEEEEFPQFYYRNGTPQPQRDGSEALIERDEPQVLQSATTPPALSQAPLAEGHFDFAENRKGISYDKLFGDHLERNARMLVMP